VVADQRRERRRDHRHHRRALASQQPEDFPAVTGPGDDDPAADRERRQRPEERADVRHRGARQEGIVGLEAEGRGGTGDHPAQRLATVSDPLGRPGAAGGEEDDGGRAWVRRRIERQRRRGEEVVELVVPGGGGIGEAGRDGRAIGAPGGVFRGARLGPSDGPRGRVGVAEDDRPQREAGGELGGGDVGGALGVGDQRPRPGHAERVVDLARRVAVVQRRRDQSGLEAGEVVDDQRDPVRHQRGDAVADRQAQLPVAAGQPRALRLELAPGHRQRHRDDRRLLRRRRQPARQQLVQRRRRGVELGAVDQHGGHRMRRLPCRAWREEDWTHGPAADLVDGGLAGRLHR
jgi:hypothetical protein